MEEKRIIKEKSSLSLSAESLPANVNVLTKEDISNLVTPRHEEIFRKIPGLYVENYGQGDIGSALTMRGLGGGGGGKKYVATYIDGVPQNYPIYFGDHILSWLIPEMIEKIEIIKGPFSSLCGDNAIGGCINIITKESDLSSITGSAGSYGSFRFIPIFSYDKFKTIPFILGEYYRTDGFRDNSDYERYNFFGKLSFPLSEDKISFRVNYYDADWNAPGFLSKTELERGIVSRKTTLTPDDGGNSRIFSIVVSYSPQKSEKGLYINAYYTNIKLNRYVAHRVYSYSPVNQEARIFNTKTSGFKAYYNLIINENISLTPGFELRYDDGYYQRYPTTKRNKSGKYTQYWDAEYLQNALFIQGQVKPLDFLKIIGGLRFDRFDYDVTNHVVSDNSGEGHTSIFSPKIGLVISPTKNFDIFANWSMGARAPYINEVSPAKSSQKKNFDLEPAKVSSWDIGFNTFIFDKIQFSFDYYQTDLKREVAIINNEPVNIGNSERNGIELETKIFLLPELSLYGSYSWVDAKVKNPQNPGQDKVIDVPKDIFKIGIEFSKEFNRNEKLYGDLNYYYISGKYYYIGKNPSAVKGPVFDKYTLNLNYKVKKLNYFLSTVYTPRKYSSEITWLNENEIMINPQPQWDFTIGLKYEF
ncbi:TonB-dependent receptor [Thermodesulfovibrio aggregans]|uniref:TonB-dependent receptor n=1 Tax=Thermodesulfovibrio aggregans TaxID=86166 RepID=UPI001379FDB6|nr:TonB-dependent receptor [Thermodesulfovibrio aggregans]